MLSIRYCNVRQLFYVQNRVNELTRYLITPIILLVILMVIILKLLVYCLFKPSIIMLQSKKSESIRFGLANM